MVEEKLWNEKYNQKVFLMNGKKLYWSKLKMDKIDCSVLIVISKLRKIH